VSGKLKSRKLWVTLGTLISVVILEVTGYSIEPAALVGLAGIVGSYVFGQGLVDKQAVKTEGELLITQFAAQLEAALANVPVRLEDE